jgi:hypothetical protein
MSCVVLLTMLIVVAIASPLHAAPMACVQGTLTSYVDLGPTGCTIDGLTLMSFKYSTSTMGGGGVTAPTADQITTKPEVVTVDQNIFPQIGFTSIDNQGSRWRVRNGQSMMSTIEFVTVGDPKIVNSFLFNGRGTVTGGGSFRSNVLECFNGAFDADNLCRGAVLFDKQLIVSSSQGSDQNQFDPVAKITVRDTIDLGASAGAGNSASLNGNIVQFALSQKVPEPPTSLLLILGIALLVLLTRSRAVHLS